MSLSNLFKNMRNGLAFQDIESVLDKGTAQKNGLEKLVSELETSKTVLNNRNKELNDLIATKSAEIERLKAEIASLPVRIGGRFAKRS